MSATSRLTNASIATRLVASAVLWASVILLIAGVVLSQLYRRNAEFAFDERLHVYLKALVADVASFGESDRTEPGNLGEPRFELPLSGWYWQIAQIDTERDSNASLRTSKSLFAARLPRLEEVGVRPRTGGISEGYVTGPDERLLRVIERLIDLGDDGRYVVAVAGDASEITAETRRFNIALTVTFVILGLALGLSALLQVRFGLRPLAVMRGEIGAIRRGEASRIIGAYPREISPLAQELNLLVDANHEIIDRARTQVGNLAHALKTPLSVIVNEARGDDSALAAKVREQAAVMKDQVQYYLDRARAAARAAAVGSVTEVEPVVSALIRTFEKITRDQGLRFSADVPIGSRFRGERQDLEEMIGNLVDNASKWTATRVHVSASAGEPIGPDRPSIVITIDDDGPGLPPDKREEATRRGRRLDETKPGSGLGLSIVSDLAALYGGRLELDASPEGGLRARLVLPTV